MARTKTTVYLEPEVLRATRIRAARTGKRDSQIVEDALRQFLGLSVVDEIRSKADLDEEAAIALAYDELNALRRERRKASK
jgi:hypothetical protein